MSEIFLSYCRRDMEFCDKVYEHLSSVCGYSVFMDRVGIEGGTQWEEVLANAIKDCKVMLLLLSQDAHDSPNVDREISFALMRNKAILRRMKAECSIANERHSVLHSAFRFCAARAKPCILP